VNRLASSLLLAIGCATVLAAGGARGGQTDAQEPGPTSWADSQHGWQICGAALCQSNNGGRTWRRVTLPSYIGEVSAAVRTSTAAGVVAGTPTFMTTGVPVAWTRNAGRSWHHTNQLSGCFQGNSSLLFADAGTGIVQVTPWPPPGRRLHTKTVWADPSGRPVCYPLANLPGGIAALIAPPNRALELAVLLHRLDSNRLVELPQTNESGVTYMLQATLSTAWPDLYVTAQAYASTTTPPGNKHLGELFWHSPDGGTTWHAGITPP
jgi:hypothetical protein